MFRLGKTFSFEASHQLPHHDGKCANLHGHSWRFTVVFEGDLLQREGSETGMLLDYSRISAIVKPLIAEYLDHRHLNNLLLNPTSEALAVWLYDHIATELPHGLLALLHSVIVHETCTSECEYWPTRRP